MMACKRRGKSLLSFLCVATAVLTAVFMGCGGGGGGSAAPGGTPDEVEDTVLVGAGEPGTPVSDEERIAALDEIVTELAAIEDLPEDELMEELAYTIASRTEFEAAGYGSKGVWGRFTDGRLIVFDNNEEIQPASRGQLIH